MISLDELQERIRLKYDADELVDLLNISVEDVLTHFSARVWLYRDNFISEEYWEDESD